MIKVLKLTIDGKEYSSSYSSENDTYRVDTDFDGIREHVGKTFTFRIINGKAAYLNLTPKSAAIALQIVKQINAVD